ncbi:hypothetical protein HDU76_004759 [Blyttiomyces sp. JEL0837]|nr:hypothetical protein HDU76_004759 [Blyttiomyces sp. JEL0837]
MMMRRTNAVKSVPSPTTRRSVSGLDGNGDGDDNDNDALLEGSRNTTGLSLIAPPRDRARERGRQATAMVTSPTVAEPSSIMDLPSSTQQQQALSSLSPHAVRIAVSRPSNDDYLQDLQRREQTNSSLWNTTLTTDEEDSDLLPLPNPRMLKSPHRSQTSKRQSEINAGSLPRRRTTTTARLRSPTPAAPLIINNDDDLVAALLSGIRIEFPSADGEEATATESAPISTESVSPDLRPHHNDVEHSRFKTLGRSGRRTTTVRRKPSLSPAPPLPPPSSSTSTVSQSRSTSPSPNKLGVDLESITDDRQSINSSSKHSTEFTRRRISVIPAKRVTTVRRRRSPSPSPSPIPDSGFNTREESDDDDNADRNGRGYLQSRTTSRRLGASGSVRRYTPRERSPIRPISDDEEDLFSPKSTIPKLDGNDNITQDAGTSIPENVNVNDVFKEDGGGDGGDNDGDDDDDEFFDAEWVDEQVLVRGKSTMMRKSTTLMRRRTTLLHAGPNSASSTPSGNNRSPSPLGFHDGGGLVVPGSAPSSVGSGVGDEFGAGGMARRGTTMRRGQTLLKRKTTVRMSETIGDEIPEDAEVGSPPGDLRRQSMRRGITVSRRRTIIRSEDGEGTVETINNSDDDAFVDAEGWEDEEDLAVKEGTALPRKTTNSALQKFKIAARHAAQTAQVSRSFYEALASRTGEVFSHAGNAAQVLSTPLGLFAGPAVAGLVSAGGAAAAAAGSAAVKKFGRTTATKSMAGEEIADTSHVKALSQGLGAVLEGGMVAGTVSLVASSFVANVNANPETKTRLLANTYIQAAASGLGFVANVAPVLPSSLKSFAEAAGTISNAAAGARVGAGIFSDDEETPESGTPGDDEYQRDMDLDFNGDGDDDGSKLAKSPLAVHVEGGFHPEAEDAL